MAPLPVRYSRQSFGQGTAPNWSRKTSLEGFLIVLWLTFPNELALNIKDSFSFSFSFPAVLINISVESTLVDSNQYYGHAWKLQWFFQCVIVVFFLSIFSQAINLLLTKFARDLNGRILAVCLICTELAKFGPIFFQNGPSARLIRFVYTHSARNLITFINESIVHDSHFLDSPFETKTFCKMN